MSKRETSDHHNRYRTFSLFSRWSCLNISLASIRSTARKIRNDRVTQEAEARRKTKEKHENSAWTWRSGQSERGKFRRVSKSAGIRLSCTWYKLVTITDRSSSFLGPFRWWNSSRAICSSPMGSRKQRSTRSISISGGVHDRWPTSSRETFETFSSEARQNSHLDRDRCKFPSFHTSLDARFDSLAPWLATIFSILRWSLASVIVICGIVFDAVLYRVFPKSRYNWPGVFLYLKKKRNKIFLYKNSFSRKLMCENLSSTQNNF